MEERIRLLLADADENYRALLKDFLETSGFEILAAVGNGMEALHAAQQKKPQVVLMELILPGLEGMGLLEHLRNGEPLGFATLFLCMAAIAAGSFAGARVMTSLSGETIRKIMGIAMLLSMGALVLKMVVSAGTVGTASSLTSWQLGIALPVVFFLGFINMFGVPMKPPAIALFLLLGMSPMSTLTLMLVLGVISPMVGGIRVMRSGMYQQKIALAGASFGLLGALLGTAFTVTLDATALSVILLIIMALTAVSMLRPPKKDIIQE